MTAYILSHDIGTTGDKATIFSGEGKLIASNFYPYQTYYPAPGWAEQDPMDYWRAFCKATKELLEKTKIKPSHIAAVSFSGQMMAALPVNREGKPLRKSLIWADLRSVEQAKKLSQKIYPERVYEITGHRLSASYSATKIMWIRENELEIYKNTFKFIHAKDFLVLCLTEKLISDYSDASGMNLLDITELKWSEEMLEATGIDRDKLPRLVESVEVVGKVTEKAGKDSGLVEGTPVVMGGGDGACATCGAGVVKEGEAYIYLGTSTWMALASERPILDPIRRTFTFCHFKRGLYFPAGTMQTGGGSYQWIKNALCDSESDSAMRAGVDVYDILNLKAEKVVPGSEGLLFLPYLMGERSPHWNPDARGCFIGLSITHNRSHLIRAVLEGVAFNMKIIFDAFREQGVEVPEIRMIGGGAKSRLWRSIFASILEKPVSKLNFIDEATSVGSAIAGGVGVGIFQSINDAARMVKVEEVIKPEKKYFSLYQKQYEIFKKSYEQLEEIFQLLRGD